MNQLAQRVLDSLESASWIRRMFEEANRLRAIHGADRVLDLSLGNPHLEPPEKLVRTLRELVDEATPGIHRYMPNPGFPEVRQRIAEDVASQESTPVPAGHVVMTVGAACGLNIALRTLLDPGDQVLVFRPYFAEYRFYVSHAGGELKIVDTAADFDLDLDRLDAAINERTRVVLVNSPNNPTGRVYGESTIAELGRRLERHNADRPRPIILLTDEPYRRIVYDGVVVPPTFPHYRHTLKVVSFSKDLGLAGERIGYIAVGPECDDAAAILNGLIFCLRTLGFVNAPALMQRLVARVLDASVDVDAYRRNRDLLYDGLLSAGYTVVKPEGAFYLFPRSPLADDVAFIGRLQEELVLGVPGVSFGQPGYFRLSYAVETDVIERAVVALRRVRQRMESDR